MSIQPEISPKRKEQLLKSFIKEFFDFNSLCKAGIFSKEIKNDYKKQAEILCKFLGLESIYEYRAKEIRCHITETVPNNNPFITVIPSIYD
jgi:hypothetical protein